MVTTNLARYTKSGRCLNVHRPPLARTASLSASLISNRLFVRIDHFAALVLWRVDDHLGFQIAEVIDTVAFDCLELRRQRAFLDPFAVLSEFHVADDGLESRFADVVGQ